ncbi:ABC transporter ATP-binding protein [Fontibacillus sp. BL9]|uniref:ABC transporter ATP-binding protein n=1 Tax=Fontibacillus sp. BL9 TaxID=3389971 RepID=UPI00397B4C63
MKKTILSAEKLCKTFSNGGVQQHVLKNVDIRLLEGDFTVIMGSSGSGKSTLLYALSGMDRPSLGEITFEGRPLSGLSNDQLAVFRRNHCGFVFQQIHLLDNMSVMDNLLAGGLLVSRNKSAVAEKAKKLLKQAGLKEELWGKFPSQLSGGEAQRAGVVRAMVNDPRILFADEPTGALNSASSESVLDMMTSVNRSGQSIVMVTHDLKTALRGNRILFLRDGTIRGELDLGEFEEEGDPDRHAQLGVFLDGMGW